jgi:AraC-like DNA-binding protein
MVSRRCIMAVKQALSSLGLHYVVVDLGEVDIMETLTESQRHLLKQKLFVSGLVLMDDKKGGLVAAVKKAVMETIYDDDKLSKTCFSSMLAEKIGDSYTHIATIFSEFNGTTIEHYIIRCKVERVKELIVFDELNITEIAWRLNYSSVAHLSNQFKKITGLTPSVFKQLNAKPQVVL